MFPDPNIGYLFGYKAEVNRNGIQLSFLRGLIRIVFRYENIERAKVTTYTGGRISWNVIRWGKCPKGTKAIEIVLKQGIFKRHLIVFEDLEKAVEEIKRYIKVIE